MNELNEPLSKILWRSTTGQLCYRTDNSSLSTVKACPRKAFYKHVLKRIPGGYQTDLDFGKAIHKALEGPINDMAFGVAVHAALEQGQVEELSVDRARTALDTFYKTITIPEDEYRHLGRAKEVVEAYIRKWKGSDLRVVSIEKPFLVPLGRVDGVLSEPVYVFWSGRIDKLAFNHAGNLWLMDIKTGSRVTVHDNYNWENSSQFKGYVFAVEQSLPGQKVSGVIVDRVIVRPPVQRETAKTPARNEFFRIPVTFKAEAIAEWQRDTLRHIANWLTMCRDEHWPMNEGACSDYRGCAYWSVCTVSDHSCRGAMLRGLDYKDNTWDPLKPENT